jgi:hypothetical protein
MMKIFKTILFVLVILALVPFAAIAQEIEVQADVSGAGLAEAIDFANAGNADVIILVTDGGIYPIPAVEINVPMTIRAADGLTDMPEIHPQDVIDANDFIKINNDLMLEGVIVDGQIANSTDYALIKYMLKTPNTEDEGSPKVNPDLIVRNCILRNMYKTGDVATSVDGTIWDVSKSGRNGVVHFEDCFIANTGDEALRTINAHKDDHVVTAEHGGHFDELIVRNCTFVNVNGSSLKLQGDEIVGNVNPTVLLENLTFYECGGQVIWSRAIDSVIVRNLIVSNAKVNGTEDSYRAGRITYVEGFASTVSHVDTFAMKRIVGDDTVEIADHPFVTGGATNVVGTAEGSVYLSTIYGYDPMFADAENDDFTLPEGSPLLGLGHDGGPLGDRNWAVNQLRVIQVQAGVPGAGLAEAIDYANDGNADVIELVDAGGIYPIPAVEINVPLIIRAGTGTPKALYPNEDMPEIHPLNAIDANDFIKINNDLMLEGVIVDGQIADSVEYAKIKYMLKTPNTEDEGSPKVNPNLIVKNCVLRNMYKTGDAATSVDGTVWDVSKNGRNGVVHFENCVIANTGDEALRAINAHKSDHVVTAEHGGHFDALTVRNCTFMNVNGSSLKLQGDEIVGNISPSVLLENLTFYDCGGQVVWSRAIDGVTVRNLLITYAKVNGTEDSYRAGRITYVEGDGSTVAHVDTFAMKRIVDTDTVDIADEPFVTGGATNVEGTAEGSVDLATIYGFDPLFADAEAGDFTLDPASPVLDLGHDGGAVGDRNWTPEGASPTGVEEDPLVPTSFEVSQNYPNPFNPTTTIEISLDRTTAVRVQVFNIMGRVVATLMDGRQTAGRYTLTWDASDMSSGVYFYRVTTGERVVTRKMMLLK